MGYRPPTARVLAERATVGANLRRVRERAGLTRGHLSARAYLAGHESLYEQAIGRIERGERDLALREAVALADILAAPLEVLTEGLER